MGSFNAGRFHLTVAVRYTPAANEVAFFCDLFNRTSRILSDATDGAHSIGTVLYAGNSMGGAEADVWIHPLSDEWPNSTSARLWFPAESMDISQDYLMWPTIMAHELAHYLYDLRDEYNNSTSCQDDIGTQASIMEGYDWPNYTRWTDGGGADYETFAAFLPDYTSGTAALEQGEPTEFCHDANHNAAADNNQNNINANQSCWTYIANDANHGSVAYGLAAPGAGGPAGAAPAAPAAVVCTTLIPVQRFVLVLDRSGSMAGAPFDQLKIGANFWVDYVNPLEELGVVTYASNATTNIARSEVPLAGPPQTTWRNDRHAIIGGLATGGQTAIGDALRRGLNAIVAGGRAASQVMILFTDGLQNAGTETAQQVLPHLRANGVRLYTIGLGSEQDTALLQSIATTTGGSYFPISGALSQAAAELAITQALVQIAGQSRDNGGVVAFEDIDGDGAPVGDGAPFFGNAEQGAAGEGRSLRFGVTISEGSTHATLGAMWRGKRALRVRIYDPSGTRVDAGTRVRAVRGSDPYAFYEVDLPAPGRWEVEVLGSERGSIGLRSIGFEVNPNVRLEATATPHHVQFGREFQLRARLLSPHPVPGARVVAHIHTPSGSWQTVKLAEGSAGTAEEGLYTAVVPTSDHDAGQYLVVIDAAREAGKFDQVIDDIYTLRDGFQPGDERRTVETPEVRRQAVLSVECSEAGPRDEPLPGANDLDPVIPKDQDRRLAAWLRAHPRKRRPLPRRRPDPIRPQ